MALRVFLSGAGGRMGRTIQAELKERPDLIIVAGSDLDPGLETSFPLYQDPRACREDFDVIIDFSHPSCLPGLFALQKARACGLVLCTTGLSASQKEELIRQSQSLPVFFSANMSLGVNILARLARQAAAALYPAFNIEIIEAHHNKKIDAPSGTALLLADQINQQLGGVLEYITDRSQQRKSRADNELGIHAIRGGNIVGQHSVLFAGLDETISLCHSAGSRAVFAHGAIAAALFIKDKPAGLYDMDSLLAAK